MSNFQSLLRSGQDAAAPPEICTFFSQDGANPYDEDLFPGDTFEKRDKWSVSWADLMMTMFVLFTVLYVYKLGNRELFLGEGPGRSAVSDSGYGRVMDMNIRQNPSDIYDQTRQAVMDELVDDSARVDMVADQAIRIALAGDILFDTGLADLKPGARERLMQIAEILKGNNYIVNVVGHTDSMPNHSDLYPTNWELSAARATQTARFLIEAGNVPEDRIFISAHAWHQPVRSNNSSANRRVNRRVEIIMMKERPFIDNRASATKTAQEE